MVTDEVDQVFREICIEIEKHYEIRFLEIGAEGDHVHFLIQYVPTVGEYADEDVIRQYIKNQSKKVTINSCTRRKKPEQSSASKIICTRSIPGEQFAV